MAFSENGSYHLLYADTQNKLFLFIHAGIKSFATALVSVFIPAFLMYEMQQPLWVAFGFWGTFFGVASLLCIPVAKGVSRYGSKPFLFFGTLFLIPYLYLLSIMTQDPSFVWLAALAGGVYEGLFFVPYHYDLSQMCQRGQSGSKVAWMTIVTTIATALAPLCGGLITRFYSAQILLQIATALTALSALPLLLSPRDHSPMKYSLNAAFKRCKNHYNIDVMTAYFGACMVWVLGNISWPLIMYIELQDYVTLGIIASVTTLVIIGLLHYVGKKLSKTRGTVVLPKIVKIQQASWTAITMSLLLSIITLPLVAILDGLRRACNAICWTTLDHATYHRATKNKANPLYTLFSRQISVNLTIAVYTWLLAALYFWKPDLSLLSVSIIPVLTFIGFQRHILKQNPFIHTKVDEEVGAVTELARA